MFGEESGSITVCQEGPDQVAARPRRRNPHLWRGITLFPRMKRSFRMASSQANEARPVFVEKDGIIYMTKPVEVMFATAA